MSNENKINEIMDNFQFHKVAKVMKYLNWQWASYNMEVPEESHIRKITRELMKETCERATDCGGEFSLSTGGFYCTCYVVGNKIEAIELSFKLDNYYSESLEKPNV